MKNPISFDHPEADVPSERHPFADFVSSLDFNIAEMTSAAAPIVLTVKDIRSADGETIIYRHVDGAFYRDAGSPEARVVYLLQQVPQYPHDHEDGLMKFWRTWRNRSYFAEGKPEVGGAQPGEADEKEKLAAKLDEVFEDWISVDGNCYSKVKEPKLCFDPTFRFPGFSMDDGRREDLMPKDNWRRKVSPDAVLFAATEFEAAVEWVRSINPRIDLGASLEFDVIAPEVFEFDQARHLATRILTQFVLESTTEIADRSDAFVDGWKAVRKLDRTLPDPDTQRAAIDLVSGLLPELASQSLREKLSEAIDLLESAMERNAGLTPPPRALKP